MSYIPKTALTQPCTGRGFRPQQFGAFANFRGIILAIFAIRPAGNANRWAADKGNPRQEQ